MGTRSIDQSGAKWAREAPKRSPSVSVLAAASEHTDCAFSRLALSGHVDLNKIFGGTMYDPVFGADPLAIRRGKIFESLLKKDKCAELLNLLYEQDPSLDLLSASERVAQFRGIETRPGVDSRDVRADATKAALVKIASNKPNAPILIDGGVLRTKINGSNAYFEADGVAAATNGMIHVLEIKSFPFIDGRCDPHKLSAAIAQAGLYVALVREVLREEGFDPSVVSDIGYIILPKNTRIGRAVLLRQNLMFYARRALALLDQCGIDERDVSRIGDASFPSIQDAPVHRISTVSHLMDQAGTYYRPECIENCAAYRLCRERAHRFGLLSLQGEGRIRDVPGVATFMRALDLAEGAVPEDHERDSSLRLSKARTLYLRAIREAKE